MAVTRITGAVVEDDPVTSTFADLASVAVGDLITVCLPRGLGDLPSSVSSDLDGALTQELTFTGNFRVSVFTLVAITAGTHRVTVSYAGGPETIVAFFDVWRGAQTTTNEESAGDTNSSATPGHGTLGISGAGLILCVGCVGGGSGGYTGPGGGFTTDTAPGGRGWRLYKIATGAETPSNVGSFVSSASWDGTGVSYLQSAEDVDLQALARGFGRGFSEGLHTP